MRYSDRIALQHELNRWERLHEIRAQACKNGVIVTGYRNGHSVVTVTCRRAAS